jgi:hypothetical protein
MLSPDGNWVWDGKQWQPIAVKHEGVFPSFAAIRVDPAEPVGADADLAPVPISVSTRVMGPPPEYTMEASYPPVEAVVARPVTPLWQQPATGLNRFLYIGAAVMVLVIAVVVLNAFVPFSKLWSGPEPEVQPTPSPSSGLAARTEFNRADRFVNALLAPAIAGVSDATQAQKQACNGLMTVSCRSALTETENQVVNAIGVIDKAEIPTCIAPYVAKVRADLAAMDTQVKLAIKGYTDNKKAELTLGLSRFIASAKPLPADTAALSKALQTQCDTQIIGP